MSKPDGIRLGFFGPGTDKFYALKLRDTAAMAQMMPSFHSELYRKLDVSVLDHVILENILGLGIDGRGEARVSFSSDREDAVKQVSHG